MTQSTNQNNFQTAENLKCLEALQKFFSNQPKILSWGIASTQPTPNATRLKAWVDHNYHAGMDYMSARLVERMEPTSFKAWAHSIVVFSFPYARPLADAKNNSSQAKYRVAAYAGNGDYHHLARALLNEAEDFLKKFLSSPDLPFYGFVDTAPVFERDLATEAGLGWRGKNACTLNRTHGSAFHLAGFFLPHPLTTSPPIEDFCGGCTLCIDQCPTNAFIGPGQLDANKCISYWTIEAKSPPPPKLSEEFGGWIFGCDICQEVCPWNHKALKKNTQEIFPENGVEWLKVLRKGGGFQSRFKHSPLMRAGRKSMLRNVANAGANLNDHSILKPLQEILLEEEDPTVKSEIGNAISRLGPSRL